jgi:cytochrome c-type biogenesis protein CcmF
MIVETGHYALVLALALALVNSVLPVWGSIARDRRLMAVAPPVALIGFGLVAYAYFALTVAHVVSDFARIGGAKSRPLSRVPPWSG